MSISSSTKSMMKLSRFSTDISPVASGSYLSQCFWKALSASSPTLMLCSEAEAAKPSRIMAIKRFRKTKLTIKMNAMKKKYAEPAPQPCTPSASLDSNV